MSMPKTIKTCLFIRQNRLRKKMRLNIMGLRTLFDVTVSIYSLILVAYLVVAILMTNDFINDSYDFFMTLESGMRHYFWFILMILPFRYVIRSFQDPGIVFSTSEYKLSMLPYNRKNIWLFACVLKWFKQLAGYLSIGALIFLATPISLAIILRYITVFLGYDILFTLPIWKLFQVRIRIKFAALAGVLLINAIIVFLIGKPIIGLFIPVALAASHICLIPQLFKHINWGRVTEVSDYKIWNMPLVSQATKTSFQKGKRYSIFRQSKRRRSPFAYTYQAIHHRMWFIYLGRNMKHAGQVFATLLLLLSVLAFIGDLYFHIGVAISIYAYINVCTSFFHDRFQSDILRVLPWELPLYKQTFLKWVLYGASVFFIPIVMYGIVNISWWTPVEWALYGSVFLYMYHLKLDKTITLLAKREMTFDMDETIGLVFLALIVASSFHPVLSLGFIVCGLYSRRRRKHFSGTYNQGPDKKDERALES